MILDNNIYILCIYSPRSNIPHTWSLWSQLLFKMQSTWSSLWVLRMQSLGYPEALEHLKNPFPLGIIIRKLIRTPMRYGRKYLFVPKYFPLYCIDVTLSAESSLTLNKNRTSFCRACHKYCWKLFVWFSPIILVSFTVYHRLDFLTRLSLSMLFSMPSQRCILFGISHRKVRLYD